MKQHVLHVGLDLVACFLRRQGADRAGLHS